MTDVFICPECGREAAVGQLALFGFIHRLDLPYFVCVRCVTVGFDRKLVRERVAWLKRVDLLARRESRAALERRATDHLNEHMAYRVKVMGYRLVRFKRKRKI